MPKHPAFTAKISIRKRHKWWFASTVLTNGSRCTSALTRHEAIDKLLKEIPGCYDIEIMPDNQ